MKHTIKKLEESKVEAVVEVEQSIWKDAQKKAFVKVSSTVTVPGFRPGKAPAEMLKGRVDQNKVIDEAINDLLPAVYSELIVEEKLRQFSRPNVNIEKISDNELTLKFTITLVPEVKLGKYKDLHAEKVAPSVTPEEVEQAIGARLKNAANLVVVDRPAKEGDTVVLDFQGFVDGKPFDGGTAENYALELGSHSFVPGFEEALVGVKTGEKKDVEISFPVDYVKELAGKKATFKCTIHEIKEKQIPELNDEAVKDMGVAGVETVDALKKSEQERLLADKVSKAENDYYNAILAQIRDASSVKIAQEIIDQEAAGIQENLKKRIEEQGISFEQYLEITKTKLEDLKKKSQEDAELNLKTYLCLEEIAETEKIEVEDKEVDEEMEKIAKQYNMKIEEVRNILEKNISRFKEDIRQKKIHDFIIKNNH